MHQIRLACWSFKEFPTVWPNKISLFRADSLARLLLQLAYDLSIRVVEKTYLIELVSYMPPFWDQRKENYHNRELKPQRWDEILDKLNLTDEC